MIVVFCGVCGKDKGQKQGRVVKSYTTLSCLENGVQKYKGGVNEKRVVNRGMLFGH